MRLYAPRQAYLVETVYDNRFPGSYETLPSNFSCVLALWPGSAEEEMEDPSYFDATSGRPFNDVCHSKVVSSDGKNTLPVMYLGSGKLFTRCITSSGFYWKDLTTMNFYGNRLFINDGNRSAALQVRNYLGNNRPYISLTVSTYLLRWDRHQSVKVVDPRSYRSTPEIYIYLTKTEHKILNQKYYTFMLDHSEVSNFPVTLDPLAIKALEAAASTVVFTTSRTIGHYNNIDRVAELFLQIGEEIFLYLWKNSKAYDGYPSALRSPGNVSWSTIGRLREYFLFHEPDTVMKHMDSLLFGKSTAQYWFNVGIQNAYLDAIRSVPRFSENSVSNILEIAGFIKSLVIDHRIEIPKSLSSVWLSYRYQYQTTKMDVEEAIEFMHRHRSLGTLDRWISCYGAHYLNYEGIDVTFRCGFDIRPKDVAQLQKIYRALYTYGLTPSFYVIWDMIPYSFIVDWLLPIGSLAAALDAEQMYSDTYYEILNVGFSISYRIRDEDGNLLNFYTRFLSGSPVTLNGFYFLEEDPVSSKVVGYRVLDTLALILGRR